MNPASHVVFTLTSPGMVRIDVFSVDGRWVRTLLDAAYPAGMFRVRWEGTDQQGHNAASGTYVLRLQSGSFADTHKIVLLK
jgi:flagellar hook assembly protein FlgD